MPQCHVSLWITVPITHIAENQGAGLESATQLTCLDSIGGDGPAWKIDVAINSQPVAFKVDMG